MKGKKTGGRAAGIPNKRTQEVIERLEELDCDPIQGMAAIAMDKGNAPELRGRMFAELAQYVAPKRKAIEHSGHLQAHNYVAVLPPVSASIEEWERDYGGPLRAKIHSPTPEGTS